MHAKVGIGLAIALGTALLLALGAAGAKSVPLTEALPRSAVCTVTVGGENVPVIDTAVNLNRTWTSRPMLTSTPVALFMLAAPCEVVVRFPGAAIGKATVRPLSLGIQPTVQGDTVRFMLDRPAQLTVERDGEQAGALHLFAQPPEADVPQGETVMRFEAGLHEVGTVVLASGQTVYLAAGAVVRGQFVADGAENIRLTGRGIIDGSTLDRWEQTTVPVDLAHCKNVTIEGITVLDPAAWTLNLYHCEDVTVRGVNIIGARSNSDGITIQSCKRVLVSGCFVRGWDDNLVVKGYDGDVADITFTDCVLWTDLAQSMEIGYETRAEVMERVTFENITVLHANHKPVCSIHNSDNALVRDVTFRNITVEDCVLGQGDGAEFLLDLTTTKSQWSKSTERGNIRGVLFDNIRVLDGKLPAVRIFAISKEHTIDNVTIRGLVLLGQSITSFDQLRYTFSPRKLGQHIVIQP